MITRIITILELEEKEAKALKALLGNLTDDEFAKFGIQGEDRNLMSIIYDSILFDDEE